MLKECPVIVEEKLKDVENKYIIVIKFEDLELQDPKEWVSEHFQGNIEPHFITFVTALAGIMAVKYLLRLWNTIT